LREGREKFLSSSLSKGNGAGGLSVNVESRFVKKKLGNIEALVVSDHALLEALKSVFPKKYAHGLLKKKNGIIEA